MKLNIAEYGWSKFEPVIRVMSGVAADLSYTPCLSTPELALASAPSKINQFAQNTPQERSNRQFPRARTI